MAASLCVGILTVPGTVLAQSESLVTHRCIPNAVTFEGAAREAFRQSLKEIEFDLTLRKAEIEVTVKILDFVPDSFGEMPEVNMKLENLSKSIDALRARIRSTSSAPSTACNVKHRSKS
ncbi:MAG: hypothetical protein JWR80_5510 [Bradyrhizobium sp.]|nr:hypothetical protein [Bradyrhizobium sp.]